MDSIIMEGLDFHAESIAKSNPNLTEVEVTLGAMRYMLFGMSEMLRVVYVSGNDLPNLHVLGLSIGVLEMLNWCAAKDFATAIIKDVERG